MRTAALRNLATVAALLAGVCLLGVGAQAQQAPAPTALPSSPDYGPPIVNEQAKAAAAAAIAEAKARTSALFRRASKVFADQFSAGNVAFMPFPDKVRPIASEGGLPIMLNGKLVGAIGVSGGTAAQDTVVATAGANAVKAAP